MSDNNKLLVNMIIILIFCIIFFFFFFFFFSSRRRHTRSKRDWSSDVCSSDLELTVASELPSTFQQAQPDRLVTLEFSDPERSEERRVGKECRSRWSPDH